MDKLLIATRNPGKLAEIKELLADLDIEILSMADFPDAPEVEEDGDTLAQNAAKKAREMARECEVHAMADDSGLFVNALDGRPGVRSARYAGPDPTSEKLCRKLIGEMQDVPDDLRQAHFACCIAFCEPDGELVFTVVGRVDGEITREMRGEGGFGYDPVFYHEPSGATFARIPSEQKNAVSHRGRALARFREELEDYLGR
jgi:XTP/dITP diphosphohydrolase